MIIQSELSSNELSPILGYEFKTRSIDSLTIEKISLTSKPLNIPFITDYDHSIDEKKWSKWFLDYNQEYLYGIPCNERAFLRVKPQENPEVSYYTQYNKHTYTKSEGVPVKYCPGCRSGIRYFGYQLNSKQTLTNEEDKWFSGDALKTSFLCPPLRHQDVLEINTEDTENPVFNSYFVPFTPTPPTPKDFDETMDVQLWLRRQQEKSASGELAELSREFDSLDPTTLTLEKLIYGLGGLGERTNSKTKSEPSVDGEVSGIRGSLSSLFKEIKKYFLPDESGQFCKMAYYPERGCLIAPPWNADYFLFAEKKRYRKIGVIPKENENVEEGELEWFFYKFVPESLESNIDVSGLVARQPIRFEDKPHLKPNYFFDIVYSPKNKSMYCIAFDCKEFIQIFYDKLTDITHFIRHTVPSVTANKFSHGKALKFVKAVVSSVDKNIYCIPFHYEGVVRIKITSENPFAKPEIDAYPADEWILEHNELLTPKSLAEMGAEV